MKKNIFRILSFILITIIVILFLSYSQKYFYRLFPSVFDRHQVVIDVLKETTNTNNILFFGDSRTMFGVDTRVIKDSLNFNGEIFNLSSVNQSISESSYYYGLVTNKTKTVVQCTSPSFFSKDLEHSIRKDVAKSMFLSGYRINDDTRKLIKNYNSFFDQPAIKNYYEARSYYRSYFNNMIRPFLDNENFDDEKRLNRYFPHIYTINRHPNYPVYNYDCDKYNSKNKPISQLSFLKNVKQYFNKKGINYILVLMPVNPDECNENYKDFKMYKKIIEEETNIIVIDLTDFLLNANLFYDASHANKEGAKLISSEIAHQLKNIKK